MKWIHSKPGFYKAHCIVSLFIKRERVGIWPWSTWHNNTCIGGGYTAKQAQQVAVDCLQDHFQKELQNECN